MSNNISENNWLINRDAVEARLEKPLTEDEWQEITEELAGRVDNFIEEILDEIINSVVM